MFNFILYVIVTLFVIRVVFNVIAFVFLIAADKKLKKDLAEKKYYNPYGNH